MKIDTDSYYDILGIHPDASLKEIRAAYFSLCKDLHPDKLPLDSNQNLRKLAEDRLKLINEAYEILKDDNSRSKYDRYYIVLEEDNINKPTESLEDLLSQLVLSQGLRVLQDEEKIIWSRNIKDIVAIESRHNTYLCKVKGHTSVYLYPDTPLLRLDRFLRIIYSGLPLAITCSGFVTFVVIILIEILNFTGILRILSFLNDDGIKSGLLWIIFLFSSALFLYMFVFDDESVGDNIRIIQEKSNRIFSDELHSYHKSSKDIGSYYRAYKLKKPTYKKSYVRAIRDITTKLDKEILFLCESRQEKIKNFKRVEIYQMTEAYISDLSASERFLLVKAIEEKAEEEKEKKATANNAKAAGAIGLLALLLGGGGF